MELLRRPPPLPPVDIRLTNEEANLLMAYVQNHMLGDSLDITTLKENLFNTLREGLT